MILRKQRDGQMKARHQRGARKEVFSVIFFSILSFASGSNEEFLVTMDYLGYLQIWAGFSRSFSIRFNGQVGYPLLSFE